MISLPLSRAFLHWMTGHELTLRDLIDLLPQQTKFLASLQNMLHRKLAIESNALLGAAEVAAQIDALGLPLPGDETRECPLSSLCFTFEFTPLSHGHGFASAPLCAGGAEMDLTPHNADKYVELMWVID